MEKSEKIHASTGIESRAMGLCSPLMFDILAISRGAQGSGETQVP